jgi:hypothetical protein
MTMNEEKFPQTIAELEKFIIAHQHKLVRHVVLQSSQSSEIKKMLGGLTIISIGESFKSGDYPGEFVPYAIRFKSGETKKFNLALRKDSSGKWYVDGGL